MPFGFVCLPSIAQVFGFERRYHFINQLGKKFKGKESGGSNLSP